MFDVFDMLVFDVSDVVDAFGFDEYIVHHTRFWLAPLDVYSFQPLAFRVPVREWLPGGPFH